MRRFWLAALTAALAGLPSARADVKLPHLFSDGLVLQQNAVAPVWGVADPGELVAVDLNRGFGGGSLVASKADGQGHWKVEFKDLKAGGPFMLTIKGKNEIVLKDVYIGDVWVCSGQSNMEMALQRCDQAKKDIDSSKNPKIRLFTVKKTPADTPQNEVPREEKGNYGKWVECNPETVASFSGVAYYFGRDLQKARNVPIGLIHTSWGGTVAEAWASPESLAANAMLKTEIVDPYPKAHELVIANYPKQLDKYKKDLEIHKAAVEQAKKDGKTPPPAPRAPVDPKVSPNRPSVLYNGMIHPLLPYAVKGAIWYQGEANAGRAEQYRTLFPVMIESWRKAWKNEDMPFLFVQLAPYAKAGGDWPRLREAQLHTMLTLKHTGMAVTTDVGEENDIHPQKKQPVGARLAVAARALAYGESIESSGPIYKDAKFDGDQAVLSFNHLGKGLEARAEDGKLIGFSLSGEDKIFYPARAEIKGDKIVVTSDKVTKPIAARYGWAAYPAVNLYNKDGLPASPFRTDDWPAATKPK
jgi:sialate O-acetylesterase